MPSLGDRTPNTSRRSAPLSSRPRPCGGDPRVSPRRRAWIARSPDACRDEARWTRRAPVATAARSATRIPSIAAQPSITAMNRIRPPQPVHVGASIRHRRCSRVAQSHFVSPAHSAAAARATKASESSKRGDRALPAGVVIDARWGAQGHSVARRCSVRSARRSALPRVAQAPASRRR